MDKMTTIAVLIVLIPYAFLLKINMNIYYRLFIICAMQLLLILIPLLLYFIKENSSLVGFMFVYNIFAWLAVFINLLFIVIIWAVKKVL